MAHHHRSAPLTSPRRPAATAVVAALLAVLWSAGSFLARPAGAATAGTVTGLVRDTSGAPVDNAAVSIRVLPELRVHTGTDGRYAISGVPAGERTLDVQPVCKPPVPHVLLVDGNETVNVTVQERNTFDSFAYSCRPARATGFGTTTGTGLTGDDEAKSVNLPFSFPFYGTARTSAFLSTNGFLSFTAPSTAFGNTAIPSTSGPNGAIYGFWDDLLIDASASVTTALFGQAPFRTFVVSWNNARIRAGTADERVSFQIRLFEDGEIELAYNGINSSSLEEGSSATMGIEDDSGTVGLQESFDVRHLLTLSDSAVRFQANRSPVAETNQVFGVVTPGTKVPLDATSSFDPDGDVLRYAWRQTFGPAGTIADRTSPKTTATAPSTSGLLEYEVRVVDSFGASETRTMIFTVKAPK